MVEFAVRRPVTVFMVCWGIIVLGWISLTRIPIEFMPRIETANFKVQVNYPGASAIEVERLITKPIEDSLSTVPGLKKMSSVSEIGIAQIQLSFQSTVNILDTMSLIRDGISGVGLPEGVPPPLIERWRFSSGPLIRLAITPKNGDSSEVLLKLSKNLSNSLVPQIQKIPGVATVNITGSPEEKWIIDLDPSALLARGIDLSSLKEKIKAQQKTYSAGRISYLGKSVPIKLSDELNSIEDLKNLAVTIEGNKQLLLSELADFREVTEPGLARVAFNAKPAIFVDILKEADANAVTTGEKVNTLIQSFTDQSSSKMGIVKLSDQSGKISSAIQNVSQSVLIGAILAAISIFLFLQKFWPTFIITVSIPLALLISMIIMYFTGVSFNLMSLAGMALGVGMLVDNSIVVLENIFRSQAEIDDPKQAAVWGTNRVKSAVFSSTLSNIAVFGPLAMVEGFIGQYFKDISLTIVYANLAALFVALFVVPMLGSLVWSARKEKNTKSWFSHLDMKPPNAKTPIHLVLLSLGFYLKLCITFFNLTISVFQKTVVKLGLHAIQWLDKTIRPLQNLATRFLHKLDLIVAKQLPKALRIPLRVSGTIVAAVMVSTMALMGLGSELFPSSAETELTYDLVFPAGQEIHHTQAKSAALSQQFKKWTGVRDVTTLTLKSRANESQIQLRIDPGMGDELSAKIKEEFLLVPGLKATRKKAASLISGKPIEVEIYSDDLEKLESIANAGIRELQNIEQLRDLETSKRPRVNGLSIDFEKASLTRLDLTSQAFADGLKRLINEQTISGLKLNNREKPIVLRFPANHFNNLDKIRFFSIHKENKDLYLEQVANIQGVQAIAKIERIDRKRATRIQADINEGVDMKTAAQRALASISQSAKSHAVRNEVGDEVVVKLGGQDEERQKTQSSLLAAVALSIFLIFLLLASQFENLKQPFIVLLSIPLGLLGVSFLLGVLGIQLSAMVFVGFVILVGTSVNSSIVLIDTANQLIGEGLSTRDALLRSVSNRLRPILMTTGSTVFGLLPLAMGLGEGAASQQPLALTVIGGLVTSTILTLVLVPILFEWICRDMEAA